jgi:hypothetical protein
VIADNGDHNIWRAASDCKAARGRDQQETLPAPGNQYVGRGQAFGA